VLGAACGAVPLPNVSADPAVAFAISKGLVAMHEVRGSLKMVAIFEEM
jgi:hypothetical protein